MRIQTMESSPFSKVSELFPTVADLLALCSGPRNYNHNIVFKVSTGWQTFTILAEFLFSV